jgi:hypothetical protein
MMSSVRVDAGRIPTQVIALWHDWRLRFAANLIALVYLSVRWFLLLTSGDPLLATDAFTYWSAPYDNPTPDRSSAIPGGTSIRRRSSRFWHRFGSCPGRPSTRSGRHSASVR